MSSIGGGGISRVVNTIGSSQTEALQSRIQGATAQLEGLTADLQSLVSQLTMLSDQLKDLKAQQPPAQAKGQKNDDYQKQVAAWRAAQDQKIEAVMAKIATVRGQIADKARQIEVKEQEVAALQAQLPAAESEDARRADRAREAARKVLDAANDVKRDAQGGDVPATTEKKKRERILTPGAPQGGGIPSGGVP